MKVGKSKSRCMIVREIFGLAYEQNLRTGYGDN